jgi:ABC-type transport system involved in multi-copper enzyme maturation permease subunit
VLAIFHREWVSILRTRKALVVQLTVAVCFAVLILLRWPSESRVDLSGTASQQLFRLFGYGLLAVTVLLAPIFPATSIVMEKRRGTLALLLNSPLGSLSIYAGKLLGVVAFALLLLALTLPAAAACYAMGGVSLRNQLLVLYGVLLLVAVQYASLGLLVSSLTSSADAAVRVTYACLLAMAVLTLAPYFFLEGAGGLMAVMVGWVRAISPIPAVLEAVGQGDLGSTTAQRGSSAALRYCVTASLLTAVFATITILRLKYRLLDRARSQGRITDESGLGVRAARRVLFVVDPNRRSRAIGDWTNPIMVKEFRTRRFGRSHWMLRLIGLCAVLSLFLAISVVTGAIEQKLEVVGGPLVLLQVGLIVLFTPSLAAGLISSEIENGAWPLLRATPLRGGAIVRGKLMSVLWTLLLILSATLPGYLVMIYIEPILWLQIVRALVCLLLAGVLAMMLSIAVGSLFQRTAAATTAAYIAVLAVFGGTLMIWLARDAPFGFTAVERALQLNPMAAALTVFNVPGFVGYDLVPIAWWIAIIGSLLLFAVARLRVMRLTRPE